MALSDSGDVYIAGSSTEGELDVKLIVKLIVKLL